jgi:hypothetical protein
MRRTIISGLVSQALTARMVRLRNASGFRSGLGSGIRLLSASFKG